MKQRYFLPAVLSCGLAALAGCTATQTSPVAPHAVAAVSRPLASAATPVVALSGSETVADLIKQARDDGYRPETINGQRAYCKSDASIGTRFVTKKCIDDAQLREVLLQERQQQLDMHQSRGCDVIACTVK